MISENSSKINKRHLEFDIARGVAIFLMIFQHLWLLIFSQFVNNPTLNYLIFLAGTVLVAPVFLFLMGANVISSRRSEPSHLFNRGLKLIILGYGLSALRFFLPITLGHYFGLIANPENIIYKFEPIYYLLQIDIFQLAGLSLIAIALLKWRHVKYDYYLILAFLVALVAPFLWPLTSNQSGFNYLLAPFFGLERYVVFPFFPWFFYPLVGVYFGNLLALTKNKTEFYKNCLFKLIPVVVTGLFFLLIDPNFSSLSYSHHGIGTSLVFISIVIYWLAIIHLNSKKIPQKLINTLSLWSNNVTLIYIVEWLLIAWVAVWINCR